MNFPIELVDKILQYDGRMKYRKGEFVNVMHPKILGFYRFILNPVLKKKVNMHIDIENITKSPNGIADTTTIDIGHFERGNNMRFIDNKYVYTNKFYFEFEFDSIPGVGLCYDYYWGTSVFEICYYDFRNVNEWNHPLQIRTTIH
tara:strand:+ start:77 stop:511 length:435 start_codon:yes stop_codon:yes gene_type:complete